MTKLLRLTTLAASVAALSLAATPAVAAPPPTGVNSPAPGTPATARARIITPLTLTTSRNLDFGDIVLGTVAAGGETVTVSQLGTRTACGSGGLTCTGTVTSAAYNVAGTNNQWVRIAINSGNPITLVNANGGPGMTYTPDAPARVQLVNSGAPGTDFTVGGSILVMPANLDGVYSANIDLTVEYE